MHRVHRLHYQPSLSGGFPHKGQDLLEVEKLRVVVPKELEKGHYDKSHWVGSVLHPGDIDFRDCDRDREEHGPGNGIVVIVVEYRDSCDHNNWDC